MGDSAVHALQGIDLDIAPGEYVGVVGPSGSGKTTLMDIIGCLSRPSAGTYELDGRRVDEIDDTGLAILRGERIGFVFQTFNLLPRLTAVENVELPMLYRRVSRRDRRARAVELLARVGLSGRAEHRPAELSGGERQRVAIARAIVMRPNVLLADEPTGNLDSRSGAEIIRIVEQLNKDGLALIVVTHDAQLGARATREIKMADGRISADVLDPVTPP